MRPARIDEPGMHHHVTNRGRNRQVVFRDDTDCELFLEHLGFAAAANGIEVHAYALMRNHYHLIVRSLEGRLSQAMQIVGGRYTQDAHSRHNTDGALFKGRFFSRHIDSEAYLLEGFRYVVNNPVKAGLVEQPEQHIWSSYPATLGLVPCPTFQPRFALVREYFGGDLASLDAFVRRADTERTALFAHLAAGAHSRSSMLEARDELRTAVKRLEAMVLRNDSMRPTLVALINYVCQAFGLHMFEIADAHTQAAMTARMLLLSLIRDHALARPSDLAAAFDMSLAGVRKSCSRLRELIDTEPRLAHIMADGHRAARRAA